MLAFFAEKYYNRSRYLNDAVELGYGNGAGRTMAEKEIALEAVWSETKKVICCNPHTGEIVFLKELPADENEDCRQAKSIDEYARRMVASGLIHKQDAESFLKHVDLQYVRTELQRTNGVLVHSYRRKCADGFQWYSLETFWAKAEHPEEERIVFMGRLANTDTCAMLDAMRTLSGIYNKILRIDLQNDTYEIIKTYSSEQDTEYGISPKCSEWFRDFALRGYVHEADLEAYLTFTELGSLRERFQRQPEKCSLHYRRLTDNKFQWVSMELLPSISYTDEHQEIMLYIRDLEES